MGKLQDAEKILQGLGKGAKKKVTKKKEKKMEKLDKQLKPEGEQLGAKKDEGELLKKADVNGDGKVDEQDLSIVHKGFAKEKKKKKVVKKED